MLRDDRGEPFNRPKNGSMNHNGSLSIRIRLLLLFYTSLRPLWLYVQTGIVYTARKAYGRRQNVGPG